MLEKDTDMLAEAREAQWTSLAFMGPNAIKLIAPAKANLFLDVMDKRNDGYHEVANIMHSLALHDVIYMNYEQDSSDRLAIDIESVVKDNGSFMGSDPGVHFPLGDVANDPERNLSALAVKMLADALKAGGSADTDMLRGTMTIRIEKHIPVQAGLGGGSSDAAAALLGAAHFWGVEKDHQAIKSTADALGADVGFFLKGGCQVLGGIGESLIKTLDPMKYPVVLVKPSAGVSAAEAYRMFDESPVVIPEEVAGKAMHAESASDVPLANNLTDASCSLCPEIAEILAKLEGTDGILRRGSSTESLMSGSGSAVFAICESYNDALRISTEMQRCGWWSRATNFSSIPAARVG